MHGELLGQRLELGLVACRFERHQHADLAKLRRDLVVLLQHGTMRNAHLRHRRE